MPRIRRQAVLFALCWTLTSCGGHSSPDTRVAPPKAAPSACAQPPAEPRLPDGAGLVQPVTDAEKDAFALASAWIDQVLDWGRALARRAQDQAAACAAADKAPVR